MARGQFKLFHSLIDPPTESADRRRRNYRLPQRNKAMAHRYYFHVHFRHLRYEAAIGKLADEFFLSEDRIIDLLTLEAYDEVEEVMAEKPALKDLATRYPQWSW